MAHFPRPGVAMRVTLASILALGYAAALYALAVFLSGQCASGIAVTDGRQIAVRPDALSFAVLWAAFAVVELPAVLFGPGLRARAFKRAAFALLLAGAALTIFLGPAPDCGTGGSLPAIAAILFMLGVLGSSGLWFYTRRNIPRDADLTRRSGGERKSDGVSRGR